MSKAAELYAKVAGDAALLAKAQEIAGGKDYDELTDAQFQALAELGKQAGISITPDEIKEYFSESGQDLSVEALDAVAGGAGKPDFDIDGGGCHGTRAGGSVQATECHGSSDSGSLDVVSSDIHINIK